MEKELHRKNLILILYGAGFGGGLVGLIDVVPTSLTSHDFFFNLLGAFAMFIGGTLGIARYLKKYREGTW